MRSFHVVLVDHRVMHGRVYFGMAQQLLHLFYGHPLINGMGCQCAAELMRMDVTYAGRFAKFAQPLLKIADSYTACA